MDLRDQFAVHFAAALVGALTHPTHIAKRAYELAEAMLSERERLLTKVDLEERDAIAGDTSEMPADPLPIEHRVALLDEPAPMIEDDDDVEPPYDPAWDLEPAAKVTTSGTATSEVELSRPGLARTTPESIEPPAVRSA